MVVLNGVFAGYEIALASVTVARLQVLVGENRAGARAALYMKQNMEASLAAIQIAMTLLAAIAAAIGGAGAAESITPYFQAGLRRIAHGRRRPGHHRGRRAPDAVHDSVGRVGAESLFAAKQGVGLPAVLAADAVVRFGVSPAVWLFEMWSGR